MNRVCGCGVLVVGWLLTGAAFGDSTSPNSTSTSDDPKSSIVICKDTEVTGSLFSTRVCHTKAQWDEIRRQSQEDLRRAQDGVNRQVGGGAPGR